MMRLRQTTISPLFHSFAAGTLLVWIAAQVLCFAHCNFGVGQGSSEQPSCHASAPAPAHHDGCEPSAPAPKHSSGSAVCSTLKSALVGSGSAALVHFDLHLLYALAPLSLRFNVTAVEPTASFFRQAQPRDWVFTPEVCLGPAHRTHAPPCLN